jgi:ketosteroid isomerase-like protein
MKHLLTLLICLSTMLSAAAQNNAPKPVDGTDCSNLFFKALLEEDAASIGSLISTDFTVVSFNGHIVDSPTLQQALTQGYIVIDSGMLTGTSTRLYGDVAVVSGQWNVSARIQNNGYQANVAYTTICVRSGGQWKVTAAQFTPIQQ